MNTADSAEEIVKIYLEGVEMSLRVTGVAAKNIAIIVIKLSPIIIFLLNYSLYV